MNRCPLKQIDNSMYLLGGGKVLTDLTNWHLSIKPKADSTLLNMRKAELVEYIRVLEHNYNAAVWFNENQAKNIERLLNSSAVVRCKDCKHYAFDGIYYHCKEWGFYSNNRERNEFCSYGERKRHE